MSVNKKQPCEVCGAILEYNPSGFLIQYHDHKDLRYWKDKSNELETALNQSKEYIDFIEHKFLDEGRVIKHEYKLHKEAL